jgi:hypothetical protein
MMRTSKENFIKCFESFSGGKPSVEADIIDFPLKKFIYLIKQNMDNKIKEGQNIFQFNFLKEKELPIKFSIVINYILDGDNYCEGRVNYGQLKRLNFKDFNITIDVSGKLEYEEVYSVISHELKHVFDVYYDSTYMEADKSKYIQWLGKKWNNKWLHELLYLSYISLRYEMEA